MIVCVADISFIKAMRSKTGFAVLNSEACVLKTGKMFLQKSMDSSMVTRAMPRIQIYVCH